MFRKYKIKSEMKNKWKNTKIRRNGPGGVNSNRGVSIAWNKQAQPKVQLRLQPCDKKTRAWYSKLEILHTSSKAKTCNMKVIEHDHTILTI